MMCRFPRSPKGSVLLVALCFVTVLGISLASYIAVCSRTMQVSNRTAQTSLSRQLAEMGLEEALRAYNKGDWSDWSNGTAADWTVSGTTATCNLTFPAGTFGQGLTGSVKIRVDNYAASQLNSTWSSSANYRINDLVGYNGVWYRSVQNNNSNQTPGNLNLVYWVPAPISWTWSSNVTYSQYTVVNYNGSWYRYTNAASSAGNPPTNATYWTVIPTLSLLWDSTTTYAVGSFVFGSNAWYRCVTTNTNSLPPNGNWVSVPAAGNPPLISWRWSNALTYAFNDKVYRGGVWYRCILANLNQGPPNITYWENALTGSMSGWSNASINYNLGDAVYYSATSQWYRCILAHTSSGTITPANTTYWATAPLFSTAWDSGKQYSLNDTVRYNGVWYLSIYNGSNIGQNPATATTYWIGTNTSTASYQWSATTAYSAGDYKCYGRVWYKCLAANTGQSPNNTTYWSASWANSFGVTAGAPVVYAEGTVNIPGSPSIKTQLRATLASSPLFPNAAAATTTISVNSGGTVDSYDGSVYTMSAGGIYSAYTYNQTSSPFSAGSPNLGYSAVLAAGYTSGTAITLSSTTVKGYLAAPSSSSTPYAPLYSSGGSVKGPSSPGSPNIDLTRVSRSPYIPKFDTIPGGAGGLATNWTTTPKGTLLSLSATTNIGTPGASTPSRYYYTGNLTIGGASIQYLKINGPVILYINGDLFITNSSTIGRVDITSTGSAEIHVTGAFKADVGGEGIQSYNTDPKSLIIISDTTGTTTQFYSEGVYPLYGVVYMPYSTSTNGYYNDNTTTNVYGAISANKITYSGANLNIHYDTSLRYATFGGVDQPYAITEWRELTDASELATMP